MYSIWLIMSDIRIWLHRKVIWLSSRPAISMNIPTINNENYEHGSPHKKLGKEFIANYVLLTQFRKLNIRM